MDKLDTYWNQYDSNSTSVDNCYIEPHYPSYPDYSYIMSCYPYSCRNKTEEAFEILKIMVTEKLIKEPTTFKKFCDLVEKIAKVI